MIFVMMMMTLLINVQYWWNEDVFIQKSGPRLTSGIPYMACNPGQYGNPRTPNADNLRIPKEE